MAIDTSFSTALGYAPSDVDNLREIILAKQKVDHAMN